MALKLKVDADGHAVLSDGKPVWVDETNGQEFAYDANQTNATISRLNGEAKSFRERAEKAEGTLKQFDGIEDPEAALKALSTVKNLDAKKLVDAGEVQKVKDEVSKALQKQIDEANARAQQYEQALNNELIGGNFARSKFISEKVAIPADLLQARFGSNFKVKDGKVVAYDQSGKEVYSLQKPGELADFDEAMELLINAYPQKDSILKGDVKGGSGANPGGGGGGNNKPQLKAGSSVEELASAIRARNPELHA